jgi:hypothetical protein
MKGYFLEKVSDINYRIATHDGDANGRLASEAAEILLLPENVLSPKYEKELVQLKSLITSAMQALAAPGSAPARLGNLHNSTAEKFIKALANYQAYLENDAQEQRRRTYHHRDSGFMKQ